MIQVKSQESELAIDCGHRKEEGARGDFIGCGDEQAGEQLQIIPVFLVWETGEVACL